MFPPSVLGVQLFYLFWGCYNLLYMYRIVYMCSSYHITIVVHWQIPISHVHPGLDGYDALADKKLETAAMSHLRRGVGKSGDSVFSFGNLTWQWQNMENHLLKSLFIQPVRWGCRTFGFGSKLTLPVALSYQKLSTVHPSNHPRDTSVPKSSTDGIFPCSYVFPRHCPVMYRSRMTTIQPWLINCMPNKAITSYHVP